MNDSDPGAQPQYSADRRWWWTGSQWIPASPVVARQRSSASGGVPAWVAIPCLVLCVPVGLALTWLTRWSTTTKLIASASAVMLWMAALTGVAAAGIQSQKTSSQTVHRVASSSTLVTSPAPPTRTAAPSQGAAGQVTVVHAATPLKLVSAPGGEFSIAIPAGWVINQSQDGQNFKITPSGASEPSIGVNAAIPVSDLRATEVALYCAQHPTADALSCSATELQYQLEDSQREWSPTESFPALIQYSSMLANVRYGAPNIRQLSKTSAGYEVIKQDRGSNLDDWGIFAMGYLNNSSFQVNTNPAYTSLAFVTGCEAPTGQASGMRAICSQALDSFRPSQRWLQSLAERQMQSYQTEFAIIQQQLANERQFQQTINRFRSDMQQMQMEEFKAMQAADQHVGDGWSAALGGKVNMQDKSGDVYLLDNGYQTYCRNSAGDIVLESNGYLSPGQSFSGNTCDEVLGPRAS